MSEADALKDWNDRGETEREMLTVIILKDILDGIEHHFGKEGLEQVTHFATMKNQSRESNRIIDALEVLYGPLSTANRS